MAGGYMGRIGFVDLTTGETREERLDEGLQREFIGGYGLGVRILFERQQKGADPLGPDNILGFMTGALTGTPAVTSGRWAVVGKSPLTGTIGDANGGGSLGPAIKTAGYDAVFFHGSFELVQDYKKGCQVAIKKPSLVGHRITSRGVSSSR